MIEATYRPNIFSSVEEMDQAVNNHIYHNANELPASNRNILRVIAAHAFTPIGTAHLKFETIANEVGCSRVTVSRGIKRLADLNIITITQGTKLNGIQGANYYSILNFSHEMIMREQPREMITRATHETPRSSKAQDIKNQTESFNSFNLCSNPFVNPVSNNVNASATPMDLKMQLRDIYQPNSAEDNQAFEELCKIAFGRLKQYMHSHSVPYLQLEQIVLKAMHDLVRKQNVKNQFAMYSSMIKRQVEQLFEQPISPAIRTNGLQMNRKRESTPEWFEQHKQEMFANEKAKEQAHKAKEENMTAAEFEARKQRILARLG